MAQQDAAGGVAEPAPQPKFAQPRLLKDKLALGRAAHEWQQLHAEERAWLKQFCIHRYNVPEGYATKQFQNLKNTVRRCRSTYVTSLTKPVGQGSRGRGRQRGSRCGTVPFKKRRNMPGPTGQERCPEIGFELYQWLIDTIFSVKSRLPAPLAKQQALMIRKTLQTQLQNAGRHDVILPTINNCWMHRWRVDYGVSYRRVNLRFKIPFAKLLFRIGIMLRNNIRIRHLHILLFGCDMAVISVDQNPKWFNSVGSQPTLALKGAKKVACLENHALTRARFTAMTMCESDNAGTIPPLAILFKLPSGVRALSKLKTPEGCYLQCGPKGSYRTEQILEYLKWAVPPAPNPKESKLIYMDWFAAHLEPRVGALIQASLHTQMMHGGGTTEKAQVPDTHIHKPFNDQFRQLENESNEEQLRKHPGKVPLRGRQEVLDDAALAWASVDHTIGARGHVHNCLTLPLDGSRDDEISSDMFLFWERLGTLVVVH